MALAGGPPAHEVPVDMARAAHELETALLSGPGDAVADVSELRVPGRGGEIPVRVYTPAGDATGTTVYFHGGGWAIGTVDSFDTVCRALANASGASVASVGYRLAPEHPFPAGLEDCLAVTRALGQRSAGAGPLAVAGDSAGANLATVVARRLRGDVALRLQALIYPVTDAAINTPSYRELGEYGLTAESMQRYWRLYLNGADGLQPDCSPLRATDLQGVAPAFVLTAGHDVLRDEGEAYARTLERAGVPVTLRRYDGCVHGFWRWQASTAAARRAVQEVGEALRAALR